MAGRVLVVGDVMTDLIVMPDGPLVRGSDRRATIRPRHGGSAANQAVWLAHLGTDVRFAARMGAADIAAESAYFRAKGVEAFFAADPELPSGILICIVDPDGERSFLSDRGANLNLCPADLPESLLNGVDVLLISGYSFFAPRPRAAVMGLLAEAKQRGIATFVDPASVGFLREVGPEEFLSWTAGVGTILANLDEALELSGAIDLTGQMKVLGRTFDRVVIKRGTQGAAVGTRDGVLYSLPAPAVPVIDTTGAGDAFAAGFITAERAGASLEASLRAGIAAGTDAVGQIGAQPA